MRSAFLIYFLMFFSMPFALAVDVDKSAIIEYWKSQAEAGDKFSQKRLAEKYERGDGVAVNLAEAAYWYRKAAEQNVKVAQYKLGQLLEKGEGVSRNNKEAFYWYQQAAINGYYLGFAELGRLYEQGRGAKRDLKKALELYTKALKLQPGAPRWVQTAKNSLAEKIACTSKAKTTLFSNEILCASREDFRQAVLDAGAKPIREDSNFWYDIYASQNVFSASEKLQMGYTKAGEFAQAIYVFPSSKDVRQVNRIRWMVQNRYGVPDNEQGSIKSGHVKYLWNLQDGVEIKVYRGWPDTTTYLSYSNPESYKKMFAEIKRSKK